jgi:hypothetical protein
MDSMTCGLHGIATWVTILLDVKLLGKGQNLVN